MSDPGNSPSSASTTKTSAPRRGLITALVAVLVLVLVASGALVALGLNRIGPLSSLAGPSLPVAVNWHAVTENKLLTFNLALAADKKQISTIEFVLEHDITCTNVSGNTTSQYFLYTSDGGVRTPNNPSVISNSKFSLATHISNHDSTLISGQFNPAGDAASGKWSIAFREGGLCQGTWTAQPAR